MRKQLLLLLLFFTVKLNAADLLDTHQALSEIKANLVAAVTIAQQEAKLAAGNPLSEIFDFTETLLPIAEWFFGIDFSGGYQNAGDMLQAILEGATLKSLFAADNIVEHTATLIRYQVKPNFCQALQEDTNISDISMGICQELVRLGSLSMLVQKTNPGFSVESYFGPSLLSTTRISSNVLSKMVNVTNLSRLMQKVLPKLSKTVISGQFGFALNFSTQSQRAQCKNGVRTCLSFTVKKLSYQRAMECTAFIDGFADGTDLATIEVYEDNVVQLHLAVRELKLGFPLLQAEVGINQLKASVKMTEDSVILDNLSKGDGYLSAFGGQFKIDINNGTTIPSLTIKQNPSYERIVYISPATIAVTMQTFGESIKEILSFDLMAKAGDLIEFVVGIKNNTTGEESQDTPLSNYHTVITPNTSSLFFLGALLEMAVSKTPKNASFGVNKGAINVDYRYGRENPNATLDLFGLISFVLSPGDYLKPINQ